MTVSTNSWTSSGFMQGLCTEKKAIGPRKQRDCSTLQSIADKNPRIVIRHAKYRATRAGVFVTMETGSISRT